MARAATAQACGADILIAARARRAARRCAGRRVRRAFRPGRLLGRGHLCGEVAAPILGRDHRPEALGFRVGLADRRIETAKALVARRAGAVELVIVEEAAALAGGVRGTGHWSLHRSECGGATKFA